MLIIFCLGVCLEPAMVFLVLVKEYERVTHSETESNRQKIFCADYQGAKVTEIPSNGQSTLHKIDKI